MTTLALPVPTVNPASPATPASSPRTMAEMLAASATLHARCDALLARHRAALDWPAWTDEEVIELGPDPEDAQDWADQNTDHHTADETPVEVLGDGPEPDWDAMADDAAFLDSYSRGVLPL